MIVKKHPLEDEYMAIRQLVHQVAPELARAIKERVYPQPQDRAQAIIDALDHSKDDQ